MFPPSDHNFQSFFNAATIFLPLSEDMGSSHAIKLAPRVGGARWQNSIFLDVDTAPPPTPPAQVFFAACSNTDLAELELWWERNTNSAISYLKA